jgi:predicted regulator of Ras-like GTPase activity (Roadblock/LC7/MglB family)
MLETGRLLFADIIGDADLTALLLDAAGAQLAGSYLDAEGREAGAEIGAALSGVGEEVTRAMRHLNLGDWHALVIETRDATIAIGAGANDSIVLVAAAASEPHGLVRRILSRSASRANEWLRTEPGK